MARWNVGFDLADKMATHSQFHTAVGLISLHYGITWTILISQD